MNLNITSVVYAGNGHFKTKIYSVSTLAFLCRGARDSKDYKDAMFYLCDVTMSGTRQEAMNWMIHFMKTAIEESYKQKGYAYENNLNATDYKYFHSVYDPRVQFIAAYDLYKELKERAA